MDILGIFGTTEILVCAIIALIVFGPERLPELAKHFAKVTKLFREASRELQRQIDMSEIEREIKRTSKPIKETTPQKNKNDYSSEYSTDVDENPYEKMGEEIGYDGYPDNQESVNEQSGVQKDTASSAAVEAKPVANSTNRIVIDEDIKTQDAARFQREVVD